MDGGIDGGGIDDEGGDVDVMAFVSRVFSSPSKDGVFFLRWRRCGGIPSGGGCVGGCLDARAYLSLYRLHQLVLGFPPLSVSNRWVALSRKLLGLMTRTRKRLVRSPARSSMVVPVVVIFSVNLYCRHFFVLIRIEVFLGSLDPYGRDTRSSCIEYLLCLREKMALSRDTMSFHLVPPLSPFILFYP